jgi:hypothetical protein
MKNQFVFIFLYTFSVCVYSFDLIKGVTENDSKWDELSRVDYAAGFYPKAIVESSVEGIVYVYDGALGKTDLNNNKTITGWPLTPWPNNIRMMGEGMHWDVRPELIAVKGGHYIPIEQPKKMMLDIDYTYGLSSKGNGLGCYDKTPLRYGDVNGNNKNEIVLFLSDDIVVFSPELQKIIFSTILKTKDELTSAQVVMGFPELEDTAPQYISENGLYGKSRNARFPAIRSFAKVFLDDFDGNGKPDIIVWRKLYESRLKTDSILGFKLEGQLFVHYQLESGEYQLQTNTPAVDGEFEWDDAQQAKIQGWLTSKNLTWQSGFPSKSECAGQEGQLIPEMHDLLLNDPDVLK